MAAHASLHWMRQAVTAKLRLLTAGTSPAPTDRARRVAEHRAIYHATQFLQENFRPEDVQDFKEVMGPDGRSWATEDLPDGTPSEVDVLRIRHLVRFWVSYDADREDITARLMEMRPVLDLFKPKGPVRVFRNERKEGEDGWEDQYSFASAWSTDLYDAMVFGEKDRRLVTAIAQPEDVLFSVPMVEFWAAAYGLGKVDADLSDEVVIAPHPSFEKTRREIPADEDVVKVRETLWEPLVDAWEAREGEVPPNALAEVAKAVDGLGPEETAKLEDELKGKSKASALSAAERDHLAYECFLVMFKKAPPGKAYGLRVVDEPHVAAGTILPPSRRWCANAPTDEMCLGTSVIYVGIDPIQSTVRNALRGMRIYSGQTLLVVCGEMVCEGEDDGEVEMENCEVLAAFNRRTGQRIASSPDPLPTFKTDNPGGQWLKTEQQAAASHGTHPWGTPKRFGPVTGYFRPDTVLIPLSVLAGIPGERNEQSQVRPHSIEFLTNEMGLSGRLPQWQDYKGVMQDNVPLVVVDQTGQPWVNEGNHRIMVAKRLGWEFMPVEVRYFCGGEAVKGLMAPENVIRWHQEALRQGYSLQNYGKQVVKSAAATLTLWHGGNLDEAYDETMAHRKGRWEFGPGLYLTTHYSTAQKYSRGGRRLYRITIAQGNEASKTVIPFEDAVQFVKTFAIRSKAKEVIARLERYRELGLRANVLINLMVNMDALKSSDSGRLRAFLVEHGVDYEVVDNAFGWGERMVVLFNMAKIVKKEVVRSKDRIDEYDLPTAFKEASADEDDEIGSGEHASTTHGQFWGSAGAGCVFYAEDTGRILLPLRSAYVNEPGTWGVWGGAIDPGEDARAAVLREVHEEAGYSGAMRLTQAFVFTKGTFRYTTFVALVPKEFKPRLNWETEKSAWVAPDKLPSPLHFGLRAALPGILQVIEQLPQAPQPGSTRTAKVVFHGSPHDFEEFKTQHIGRGEGNQSYGWGLYFTDTQAVADYYRNTVSGDSDVSSYLWNGKEFKARQGPEAHALSLAFWNGIATAKKIARQGLADCKKGAPYALEQGEAYWARMLEVANQIKSRREIKTRKGLIYEVDIPDGPYLLWDEPFHAQDPRVQKALKDIEAKYINPRNMGWAVDDPKGSYEGVGFNFLYGLAKSLKGGGIVGPGYGGKPVSDVLRSYGIAGTKFLDQDSRNRGVHGAEKTYNYVIFDDKDVKVLKKSSVTAAPKAPALEPLVQEFMAVADPEGGVPPPEIKYVNRSGVDWLGICYRRKAFVQDDLVTGITGEILIQRGLTVDLDHLRRVVAHEVCHHVANNELTIGKPTQEAFQALTNAGDGHDPSWLAVVRRINAVYGADFVTKVSDTSVHGYDRAAVYVCILRIPGRKYPVFCWLPGITDQVVRDMKNVFGDGEGGVVPFIVRTNEECLIQPIFKAQPGHWPPPQTRQQLDALEKLMAEGKNLFEDFAFGGRKARPRPGKGWTLVMANPKRNAEGPPQWISAWTANALSQNDRVAIKEVREKDGREVLFVRMTDEADLEGNLPKFSIHDLIYNPGRQIPSVMQEWVQDRLLREWHRVKSARR